MATSSYTVPVSEFPPRPRTLPTTPRYWWDRASSARAITDLMSEPDAKGRMLDVAAGYERSAKQACAWIVKQALGGLSSIEPDDCCCQVNGGEEVARGLVVARGDGTELLESSKEVLNEVTRHVEVAVVIAGL